MSIGKVLASALLALLLVGCSSRAGKVGPGDNVPVPAAGDVLRDVNFAFDSYTLDAPAKASLKDSAAWLAAHPQVKVQIEGHCDERGTNEYNMALGAKRAQSAMDYMRSLGVDASRMATVSYGEELPLDPGHDEAAWAKNRRAHFNAS